MGRKFHAKNHNNIGECDQSDFQASGQKKVSDKMFVRTVNKQTRTKTAAKVTIMNELQ